MSTMTKVMAYILFWQTLFMYASAIDLTLSEPSTTIKAQIGEVYHIRCQAYKCQKPEFTWSSLMDQTLSGRVNTSGQISILTMKITSESDGSYRCTVSCDKPPVEKVFKVLTYSFPTEPLLNISSLVVGKKSRITCIIPDIYPPEMFSARIYLGEEKVAEYEHEDIEFDTESQTVKNISISYNFILNKEYETEDIRCLTELAFQDDTIDPIKKNTLRRLNLLYPPEEPVIKVVPLPTVRVEGNVFLSCIFKGRSPATVQWVKLHQGNELELSSNETLAILDAKPEDSGIYRCYVQNKAGKTFSQVKITVEAVPERPNLSIHPKTTKAGQPVTIECVVTGNTNVNVTLWKVLKEGDISFLKEAGSYIIEEANPIDAGTYKCIAENQYGTSMASESLKVEYAPTETLLLASDEEVNEGDTVTLSCSSKGVPEPSFFLYHLLPSGESILLSEGPEVTLTKGTSGLYQCEARNTLGTKRDKLELRLRSPPKNTHVSITPSSLVTEGAEVQIHCISEAFPTPRLVLKKKTELGLTDLPESENGFYRITNAGRQDMGIYICESVNGAGQQTAEVWLNVQTPPRNTHVSITPSTLVTEGDEVQIQCISEAFPTPRLVLKKKAELGLTDLPESENGLYRITNAGRQDMGIYICESVNGAGQQTAEARLDVQVPSRNTTVVTPSQNIAATVTTINDTHIIPYPERQQSPRSDYVTPAVIGSVALASACAVGIIVRHLKQAKVQGSYSLVKALRNHV